jgi:hypothetical protein
LIIDPRAGKKTVPKVYGGGYIMEWFQVFRVSILETCLL